MFRNHKTFVRTVLCLGVTLSGAAFADESSKQTTKPYCGYQTYSECEIAQKSATAPTSGCYKKDAQGGGIEWCYDLILNGKTGITLGTLLEDPVFLDSFHSRVNDVMDLNRNVNDSKRFLQVVN